MYHQMENHHVLEQFSPLAGVESWNLLATEDFSYAPSKMMNDHSLVSHMDHGGFITMKCQEEGMEEVVLDSHHVDQLFFDDSVVPGELVVEEQSVEVGQGEEEEAHAEIILVPNNTIKQEDVIEGEEIVIGSGVEGEVVVDDMDAHHLDHPFEMGSSSVDIPMDDAFEDTKLRYALEEEVEPPQCVVYDCGECGLTFRSRTLFKRHVKSVHAKAQKKAKKSKDKSGSSKRYTCPSCEYSSQRRDKLDKHMEKHVLLDGVHPCGKRRHKPEALPQRHRHNAEEYRCLYCPYSCTVYRALKKHQRVHAAGNETFTLKLSCKICGKDRPTEAEMARHMKKHKRDEHFLCDLCEFSSVQLKKIIQHRRMHTGEKPHLCPHCSYRSARRDNLRSHVRRMHKRPNMYIDTFNPNEHLCNLVM